MLIATVDAVVREATLFAAVWFLVGGLDDLLVDLIYLGRRLWHRIAGRRHRRADVGSLHEQLYGRLVIFVAAWDEAAVIGQMLRAALIRFDYPDYRIYVGTYSNDPATMAAVAAVAGDDARIRMVVGGMPGPTTKADCLNAVWRALLEDEAAEGFTASAIILHDAEDIVHPLEMRVFARHLPGYAGVQLPVVPLRHPRSRFIAGHYCDEFAEAHAKQMLVRAAVGAGLPFAGVGCAIRRDMIARIAEGRSGMPFDATSLTEDYELGLTVAALGGKVLLAREPECAGGRPVAVRAYFPAALDAAVRQKSRWMTGIALAGWDRIGWGPLAGVGDHWMRMRDRRATLAIPVLVVAYVTLVLWGLSLVVHAVAGSRAAPLSALVEMLLAANLLLLLWRLAVRAAFVRRCYDWPQAWLSIPRFLVGNYIALLASRRAIMMYLRMLAGAAPRWDKTPHEFPGDPEQARA